MKRIRIISLIIIAALLAFGVQTASASTGIKPPTGIKAGAKAAGFVVKYKKSTSNVSGYKIQYSASRGFSNSKTVTVGSSTTKKTIKKLKSGKKYYVRVRAYKGASYSRWTSVKSVVTKLSAGAMVNKASKGYWYIYSPQDTVADAYKMYKDGTCQHLYVSCNQGTVKEYKSREWTWYVTFTNKFRINETSLNRTVKYVPAGDYGKYVTKIASGPMDPQKVVFKVYHYSGKPSASRFMSDWNNKFIK